MTTLRSVHTNPTQFHHGHDGSVEKRFVSRAGTGLHFRLRFEILLPRLAVSIKKLGYRLIN